jgi:tRNA-binding EMAP/Myf-like protein
MNTTSTKQTLTFKEFLEVEMKLDIRMGKIVAAVKVPKSYGLALTVVFGPEKSDERSVFTNLGKDHEPEALIGRIAPFVLNLEPSEIKGIKSEAMILTLPDENNLFSIGTPLLM